MTREYSMDRRAYLTTIGAGSTAALAGCSGLGGAGDDTIVPGTAPGFQPFEYKNDENELVGFDVELTEAVIERTSYEKGDWVEIGFDQLETSLLNGDIDLIAAALSITEDRKENVDFSDPYYEVSQAVVVRENGEFQPEELSDFEAGRRVGAQGGTTGEDLVESELIEPGVIDEEDYRSYDNYNLAVEDLVNGNIAAVMVDEPTANSFADERPVAVTFTVGTGENYGLAMRPDDDRLSDINEGLASVRENGTYEELRAKYIG